MQDGGDGTSVLEHLRAARKRGAQVPQLDLPVIPEDERAQRLVQAFAALSGQRQMGMSGPQRITVEAMTAWAQIHGHTWSPWEFETLCAMDGALLRGIAAGRK